MRTSNNHLINAYNVHQSNTYKSHITNTLSSNPLLSKSQSKYDTIINQTKTAKDINDIRRIGDQHSGQKNTKELDALRQIMIQPIKIEKKNDDVKQKYDFVSAMQNQEREVCWALKTNTPYKNIIPQKTEKTPYGFDYTQKIKKDESHKLIIHTVTNLDKDKDEIEDKLEKLEKNIGKQNKKNKKIFSDDNYEQHKEKFEYEHIFFYKISVNQKDHTEMKDAQIQYHIQKQKQTEVGSQHKDDILKSLDNEITKTKNDDVDDLIEKSLNLQNDDIDGAINKILNIQQKIDSDVTIDDEIEKLINSKSTSHELSIDEEINMLINKEVLTDPPLAFAKLSPTSNTLPKNNNINDNFIDNLLKELDDEKIKSTAHLTTIPVFIPTTHSTTIPVFIPTSHLTTIQVDDDGIDMLLKDIIG